MTKDQSSPEERRLRKPEDDESGAQDPETREPESQEPVAQATELQESPAAESETPESMDRQTEAQDPEQPEVNTQDTKPPASKKDSIETMLLRLVHGDPGEQCQLVDKDRGFVFRRDKPNSGQDASPLYRRFQGNRILLGVFDGMGGRGGEKVNLTNDSDNRPNAYFASRLVKSWVERLVQAKTDEAFSSPKSLQSAISSLVHKQLVKIWDQMNDAGLRESSAFGGTMFSALPTTMSLALVQPHPGDPERVVVDTLNCGDSRIYVLEAGSNGGLAILTEDDVQPRRDAFDLILDDAPLKEYLNGNRLASVSHRRFELRGSCAIFACSDGFHHYHRTPLEIERFFMQPEMVSTGDAALPSEGTDSTWFSQGIEDYFLENLHDDVTLALHAPLNTVAEFLENFNKDAERCRRAEMLDLLCHWAPQSADKDRSTPDLSLWKQAYRFAFERYLLITRHQEA